MSASRCSTARQRQAALVAQNVDAFGAGLDIPIDEVRLYLAVRELAHARLFRHAKWLRLHLLTQITDFARGIRIDTDRLEQLAADFDPSNPEELRAADDQRRADPAEDRRAARRARPPRDDARPDRGLGGCRHGRRDRRAFRKSGAIAETVRRRRAAGGPAESAFATLVGLELRPRRLREAAAMWQAVQDAVGAEARDALWAHPDIVPTDADIDDPAALVARLRAARPSPTTSTRRSKTC